MPELQKKLLQWAEFGYGVEASQVMRDAAALLTELQLCSKHQLNKWQGDATCVVCENQQLYDQLNARNSK